MTPDEGQQLLAAAQEQATRLQWDDVDHLLRPAYDAGVLTGTDQGDAAYYLGAAYMHMNAWDAAQAFLTEAAATAGHVLQTEATQRLTEVGHHDGAIVAEIYGADAGDAAATLAAGDEALARNDYADAHAKYWAVYDGSADDASRMTAAMGLATAFAYSNDFEQATQFATYVAGSGQADVVERANTLLTWLHDEQHADAASADGTTADEYRPAMEAAREAIFVQDYAQALPLLLSVLAADQLASIERAKAAYNAGFAELFLGQDDAAREHFQFAVDHGQPSTADKANARLAEIDRHEAAEALVPDPE